MTADISAFLQFCFWERVLYLDHEESWPRSHERPGYWLGVAHNIGDALTYWIYDDQSKQVLARSVVRPYNNNKRVTWDPIFARVPIRYTAHKGGEKARPSQAELEALMSNVMDKYDMQEPDPTPREDPSSSIKSNEPTSNNHEEKDETNSGAPNKKNDGVIKPKSVLKYQPINYDGNIEPIEEPTNGTLPVEYTPDPYQGNSYLRYSNKPLGQHPEIPIIKRNKRLPMHVVRYKENFDPPEIDDQIILENTNQGRPSKNPKITSQADDKESPNKNVKTNPRRSTRLKKKTTTWTASALTRTAMLAAALVAVPNTIYAEPAKGFLLDTSPVPITGVPILRTDPTTSTERIEKLRAYHARLDQVNDLYNEDPELERWKVACIDKYLVKTDVHGNKCLKMKVLYQDGAKTWIDLNVLRMHDPMLCIKYAFRHNLLGKPGWEWINHYMESDQEFGKMVHAYKVSRTTGRKFKFGIEVPKNVNHARELDGQNGDNQWKDAIDIELKQINDYQTFKVVPDGELIPKGYKRIPYHIVFDVKFDGRRKARLVAGGHRSPDVPVEDAFSGVVSMEAVRIGFILARMNGLQVCAGDVGNAFLYGKTREKLFVIAGPEFGPDIEEKRLIIDRSLYGLKTSAARFHEHLSIRLRKMGFKPSKADPDLWIRRGKDGLHEYIARFVDDVIAFSKNPMAIMKALEKDYIMKGVGKPQYYLGGDVVDMNEEWHQEGIYTAFSAETYIRNCLPKLASMCGIEQFAKSKVPFDPNYHAELDDSPLCDSDTISKYRSLIGSANWVVTLGRFDISYALSTLSRYCMAPREGHVKAMHKLFGYLRGKPDGKILIDIGEAPVRNEIQFSTGYSWTEFYPDACEELPYDMPEPSGMKTTITIYVDADHARDKVTCRSVTGILLLLNNTPLAWVSKRQKTVESSTYGSELVAARIAVDLLIEMRYKMRMLGVPLEDTSVMIGDNMSVVLNTTLPSSNLKKKCQAINYHRVREAIAAGFTKFGHIDTKHNVADIFTKPLPNPEFSTLTSMYLFRHSRALREARNSSE